MNSKDVMNTPERAVLNPAETEHAVLNGIHPAGQRARELRIISLLEAILAKLDSKKAPSSPKSR